MAAYLDRLIADGATSCWPLDEDPAGNVFKDVIGGLNMTPSLPATMTRKSGVMGKAVPALHNETAANSGYLYVKAAPNPTPPNRTCSEPLAAR